MKELDHAQCDNTCNLTEGLDAIPKEVRADVAQTFLDGTSSGDLAIRDQRTF